jgi:signal peptidase
VTGEATTGERIGMVTVPVARTPLPPATFRPRPAPGRPLTDVAARWALAGLAIGFLIAALPFLPWPSYVVSSGSMEPVLDVGTLIVARPVDAGGVAVGDVIVFTNPAEPTQRVVHRVVGETADGWRTRGDANPVEDPWIVTPDRLVGEVVAHVDHVGTAVRAVQHPVGYLAVVILPALGATGVVGLARRRGFLVGRRRGDGTEEDLVIDLRTPR